MDVFLIGRPMSKFEFKPEHFKASDMGSPGFLEIENAQRAAAIANALLQAHLEKNCRKVYCAKGYGHHDKWLEKTDYLDGDETHFAYLINETEIKKDEG